MDNGTGNRDDGPFRRMFAVVHRRGGLRPVHPLPLAAIASSLIVVNGFFVAVEFALMAVRRPRIERMTEDGVVGAGSVLGALDSINVQLAASQLGISIVSLLIGWLVEPILSSAMIGLLGGLPVPTYVVRSVGLVIGLGLVAFVHMVFGEMVPRTIALARPDRTARMLVPLHLLFVAVTRPAVHALHWMGRVGTRLVGVEPIDELAPSHTASELAVMIDEAHESGQIAPDDHGLLAGAFAFLGVRVGQVMACADDLVTIPHTATVGEAERLMHESGHSRVLVMGSRPDQVIGFLHAKDLINLTETDRSSLLPPGLIRVALRVGPEEPIDGVMLKMRRARRHVAVVMERRRVAGLVTLEDLIESIVGDIMDETDRAGEPAKDVPTDRDGR